MKSSSASRSRSVRSLPVRVKRFANGAYAISVIDRENSASVLIEGSTTWARVVHVDAQRWAEAQAGSVIVPSGRAGVSTAYQGTAAEVTATSTVRYPDTTVRRDVALLSADGRRREATWALPSGAGARGVWRDDGSRDVVRTDPQGNILGRARTTPENETGLLRTVFEDSNGARSGTSTERAGPDDSSTTVTTDADGTQTTVVRQGSNVGVFTTSKDSKGTITQTAVFSTDTGVSRTQVKVAPDGSSVGDSVASMNDGAGHLITTTQHTETPAAGKGSPSGSTSTKDNDTGETSGTASGTNADGSTFQTGSASDGNGNYSQTTVTKNADGSFNITTITGTSGVGGTVNSQDYDANGNPIAPSGGSGGGSGGGGGGDGGGGDGDGDGGDEGGDGDEGDGGDGGEGGDGGDGGDGGEGGGGEGESSADDDGINDGAPSRGIGLGGSEFGDLFGNGTIGGGTGGSVFGGVPRPGNGGDGGDGGPDPRIDVMRAGLVADVDDGGTGGGLEGDTGPRRGPVRPLSDVYHHAAEYVPLDEGPTVNPRLWVAAVARVAGASAAAVAQRAVAQLDVAG